MKRLSRASSLFKDNLMEDLRDQIYQRTGNSLDGKIMAELEMMSDEEKQVFYNMILFNRPNRKVV